MQAEQISDALFFDPEETAGTRGQLTAQQLQEAQKAVGSQTSPYQFKDTLIPQKVIVFGCIGPVGYESIKSADEAIERQAEAYDWGACGDTKQIQVAAERGGQPAQTD